MYLFQQTEIRERRAKEKENQLKGIPPGLSLPLPALPILAQPPPFAIPPPNLSIPPPTALSHAPGIGGIPFPPPNVSSTSSQMPTQPPQQNIFEHQDPQQVHDINDGGGTVGEGAGLNSPTSIDQQLSMTERQINMVEQQLNMIQQAQNMNQPLPGMPPMHSQALFHQSHQPNPMIFDMPPPQMLHGGPQMLDSNQAQQIPIFANSPLLGQQAQMLPISQASLNQNLNGNSMHHYGGRY